MVSKLRFGHCEISVCIWLVSIVPIIMVLWMNPPFLVMLLILFSIIIGMFGIGWLPYYVSKYQLRPGLDKCKINETTWMRVTKDHIIAPQFVNKGPYGQTKGTTYKEKADVVDDGSFPCKWLNGNPAVIMYDMVNTNIDLRKSVARKKMKEEYNISNGVAGYNKAVKEGEVVHSDK